MPTTSEEEEAASTTTSSSSSATTVNDDDVGSLVAFVSPVATAATVLLFLLDHPHSLLIGSRRRLHFLSFLLQGVEDVLVVFLVSPVLSTDGNFSRRSVAHCLCVWDGCAIVPPRPLVSLRPLV